MATVLAVLAVLLYCAAGAAAQTTPAPRIVGGSGVAEGEVPFATYLELTDDRGTFVCGGSLIAPNWVLTAAHCATAFPVDGIEAMVGSVNRKTFPEDQRHRVAAVFAHPDFDGTYLGTDINESDLALLKLETPSSFPFIPLVEQGDPKGLTQSGRAVTIAGWGSLAEGQSVSDTLLAADVFILSKKLAELAYGTAYLTHNMFPAGLASGGKDACGGDSGAPLFTSVDGMDVQLGLMSWGSGCAEPGIPSIYTRLSNFRSWVETTMAQNGGTGGTRYALPHLTPEDDTWTDHLLVDNQANATARFTLSLFAEGEIVINKGYEIAPLDHKQIDLSELGSTATCGLLTTLDVGLAFQAAFENDGGGLAAFPLTATRLTSTAHAFSNALNILDWKGLALMNTDSSERDVTFFAIDAGEVVSTSSRTIPAHSRLAATVESLFPELDAQYASRIQQVVAATSVPVLAAISLGGSQANDRLLFAPASSGTPFFESASSAATN